MLIKELIHENGHLEQNSMAFFYPNTIPTLIAVLME